MGVGTEELKTALALLRQGQQAPAEQICRRIVEVAPDDFGANHLLGVIELMRGEPAGAERHIAHAIAVNPGVAGAHYNHGNALLALDRAQEAIASYDSALALQPGMAEALHNRGKALSAVGRHEDAAASHREALAIRPDLIEAHDALGSALMKLQRHEQALASFDEALARNPSHAGALNNRGSALYALDRFEEAVGSYEHSIKISPMAAEPHDNRGLALQALGRFEEAIASHGEAIERDAGFTTAYIRRAQACLKLGNTEPALRDSERAVALQPSSAAAFDCRGIVHNEMGWHQEALADYRKAIALDPGFAQAHNNMGNVLYDLGRMDEALESLQEAIDLRPGFPEAYGNRGMVLQDSKRFDAAHEAYDMAIAGRPGYAEAYKRRATLQLLQGNYRDGWVDYEDSLRYSRSHMPAIVQGIAQWEGQSLQGKSIVLSEPSGLGDTIEFWRFVPAIIAMGARVSFLGPSRLFRLLRSSPWPVRLLSELPAGECFDYRCELWSLPYRLGIGLHGIPRDIPYLAAETDATARWSSLLGPDRFNIGISWQGNPGRKIDAGRSIPLAAFRPLAMVPGVQLVSLQKGHGVEQLQQLPADMPVLDPGPQFDSGPDAFVDSAALMAGLDLVISSDTAIVHLAGAMGRPTWLALKWVPEWRWLLDRDDSPWYPSLRLFRQHNRGDWAGVFEDMAVELRKTVG